MTKTYLNVMTKQEHQDLLERLYKMKRKIYQVGANPYQIIETYLTEEEKRQLDMYCKQKKCDFNNPEQMQEVTEKFIKFLNELESVHITLAYKPTYTQINRFKDKFMDCVGKPVVLVYKYDPYIVGGIIIEYKGRYFRDTLDILIDKVFAQS